MKAVKRTLAKAYKKIREEDRPTVEDLVAEGRLPAYGHKQLQDIVDIESTKVMQNITYPMSDVHHNRFMRVLFGRMYAFDFNGIIIILYTRYLLSYLITE